MDELLKIQFDVPEANLETLSFAEADVIALNQWVSNLPLVNSSETASRLSLATQELACLKIAAPVKFELAEVIRPIVHYICTRLDRSNIDRGTLERGTTKGTVHHSTSQNLMISLCTVYKSIIKTSLEASEKPRGNQKEIVPKSMHRLISDMSRVLLRSLQLYLTPPPKFWYELNQTFTLSERMELNHFRLTDSENHTTQTITVEVAYLRALLLASCNPNQLQQRELASIFNTLEDWAQNVILDHDCTDGTLIIDLEADAGPSYEKVKRSRIAPRCLRTEVLAYEIEAYLKDVNSTVAIPESLPNELLQQLVEAWSAMRLRTFRRFDTDGTIRVCVGLSAAHYFLSGGVEFAEQIANTDVLLRREVNPFLDVQYEASQPTDDDPWSQAHDLKVRMPVNPNIVEPEKILIKKEKDDSPVEHRPYDHFETKAVDTSPGGYCVAWEDSVPATAKVGELVALREEADPRWCIAVIRWIRQQNGVITMGIELLSPRAIPVAIRVIQKKGGPTDYARALLLPEIEALKQAGTLLTPSVPFTESHKVHVQRQGIQSTAQLLESELKTESFNQFSFRMLDGYLESNRAGSTIESLSAMTREDTNQGP